MGGAVSTGQDNDDLIDNLLHANYIRSSTVERVFRAVDRADYFLPEARGNAYKDLAWKSGFLHLSAPCIYSEVMEGLCLSAGLSFLNLGSGTGYLSTMVGLILGSNGINHGVEIHGEVIQYANKKLLEFKKYSGAIDEFDFSEPKFIQGNCLCLTTDRQYDRVYCGATCPEHYESYMKNLLRVGGILVMPLNDHLMQIKRTSDVTWEDHSLLPVSFATLVQPVKDKQEIVELLDVVPLSLQSLCRAVIRTLLRKNVELENPNFRKRRKPKRKRRNLRKWLVEPIYDSGDDPFSSDDERRHPGHRPGVARRHRTTENIFNTVMDHLGNTLRQNRVRPNQEEERLEDHDAESAEEDHMDAEPAAEINEARAVINNRSRSNAQEQNNQDEPQNNQEGQQQPPTEEEDEEEEEEDRERGSLEQVANALEGVFVDILQEMRRVEEAADDERSFVDVLQELEEEISHVQNQVEQQEQQENAANVVNVEVANNEIDNNNHANNKEPKPSTTSATTASSTTEAESSNKKCEKFDSGLGEEMAERDNTAQDSSGNETMDVDSSSSNDEVEGKRNKRGPKSNPEIRSGAKWRRICLSAHRLDSYSNSSDSETVQEEPNTSTSETKVVQSPYTQLMRAKIQELPLPPILKNYLNFYREFN